MLILILLGFVSGIISGMGIGGGTILIPALVFFMDISQQQSQIINLVYFMPTAIMALIMHKKSNNIETKVLKPIIIIGLIGAVAGSLIAVNIDNDLLKKLFGGFLLIMGILEIRKKDGRNKKETYKYGSNKIQNTKKSV